MRDISESSSSTRERLRRLRTKGALTRRPGRQLPHPVSEGECDLRHLPNRGRRHKEKGHLRQRGSEGQLPNDTDELTFITGQGHLLLGDWCLRRALSAQWYFGRDNAHWLLPNVKDLGRQREQCQHSVQIRLRSVRCLTITEDKSLDADLIPTRRSRFNTKRAPRVQLQTRICARKQFWKTKRQKRKISKKNSQINALDRDQTFDFRLGNNCSIHCVVGALMLNCLI